MFKIRNGVFETNSSSMHSLVIKKTGKFLTKEESIKDIYIDENGKLKIYEFENSFDRSPFKMLYSPEDKFLYLVASYNNDKKKRENIIELFKEELKIKEIDFPITYNKEVNYGYIDHQSLGFVRNYIEKNEISFKDFIFNNKYIVIIDGDEYGEWDNIKESGLINLNEIEMEISIWSNED